MVCQICNKNGTNQSEHHYYHPKKKYRGTPQRKVRMYLHRTCHMNYHNFYLKHCLRTRQCEFSANFVCHYSRVCCYYVGNDKEVK
jgi:hypothetical protein